MYNVLLCQWQHGLITRDEMESELHLKVRPVFMREPYHMLYDSSDRFMNGYRWNIDPSYPDVALRPVKDFWNISGKQAQDFSDTARWYEEDEYGEWHDGYWQGDTWIPEGYGGMIHVDETTPTEVYYNGDNRADAYMRSAEYSGDRNGYYAEWMMDWNYDWIATKDQWSDMRGSGSSGQFIDWSKATGTTMVAFASASKHGESLYDTGYWHRYPDDWTGDQDFNTNNLHDDTIGIRITPGDRTLYISYMENFDIGTTNYVSRRSKQIDSHKLITLYEDAHWGKSITDRSRIATELPKEMMFRVERWSWDRFLILAFSKARYVSPYGEFGVVNPDYYASLLASGHWNQDIGAVNRLDLSAITHEPVWQLSSAWIYESFGGAILPDFGRTHVFSSWPSYYPENGKVRWQNDTSDLYIKDLSHKISNLVDYSDVRSRSLNLRTYGIMVADNTETELFLYGRDSMNDAMTLFQSAPTKIETVTPVTLFMSAEDYANAFVPIQMDGGGKNLTMPLHIRDTRMNDNIPLYLIGGIGAINESAPAFVYDDTTLQNFLNDAEWAQWAAPIPQQERWDDQVTYTRFDVTITNSTLPADREHFHKDFGDDYFQREFVITFEYEYREQAGQAQFMPFIMGEHTRWPELFNPGDDIMSLQVEADGEHLWKRANTAEEVTLGYPASGVHYYVKVEYGPMYPYGSTNQFIACQISFFTNSTFTGTPAFTTYHRMDDLSYLEAYDQLAIGAAVSSGTYSFVLENLWLEGSSYIDTTPLITDGHQVLPDGGSIKLRTTGLSYPANSYTTLQVFGGSMSGSYWYEGRQNLFLYHYPFEEFSIPMVIFNNERPLAYDSLPLYIGGVYPTATDAIPITLWHDMGIEVPIVPLWIAGLGTVPGYNNVTDEMLCYINRPDQSTNLPLLVYNDTPGSNSYVGMRIEGVLGYLNDSCTLVMPNTKDGSPNSFMKLQMTGGVQVVDEATLALPETLARINAGQPMICYHSGGAPNSYVNAFIDGAYKSTGYTTLTIPNVYHIPTQTTPLYIRGY
jgi:hypothetical protein